MTPKIEKVCGNFKLGEGPYWDITNKCLYFVDMRGHTVNKYVPATNKLTSAKIGEHNVSIIIPVKGKKDEFVVSLDRTVAIIKWDGESKELVDINTIYEVDKDTINVFNDGKCDPTGRLWIGTMGHAATTIDVIPDGKGTLYSFQNNKISSHRTNIGIANGIAFNAKLQKMYYIDSFRGTVDQYNYDMEKGTISNLQHIFTSKVHNFEKYFFDGMTIDADGNLWIALFGGSKVIKIDPRKKETLLETIEFPASQITSVSFGGPNLDELYVTSASILGVEGPMDGALFRVTGIDAKGVPAEEFVL